MAVSRVHHNLPTIVSKSIVKSMIGSLNATAIAYARMHLRYDRKADTDDIPTIDKLNDEMAAVAEQIERQRVAAEMGHAIQMPTAELIERLMALRSFYVDCLLQMKAASNDMPLTIAETLKFQMDRQPDSNDSLLVTLAEAVEIDVELLRAAQVKMLADDAADLRANAGRIADYLGQFCGTFEGSSAAIGANGKASAKSAVQMQTEYEFDDDAVEANFAALPKHVQYKLIGAAIRAHDKSNTKALQQLLRGKLDAAGDIKMLKANRSELIVWLKDFTHVNQVALDEYVERGGMLPEIEDRTVVTSNKAAAPTPASPAAVTSVVAAIEATKAEKPKMQRAPKPSAEKPATV